MACWHPAGLLILRELERYIRELLDRSGYMEGRAPLVCDAALWERSGHLAKFADKMFHLEVDGRAAALRPMNCPGHCDLYAHRPRSYREHPLRIAEQGHVHRAEQSGELNGLLRARSFVIDDAHLFCAPDQVDAELSACLAMAGALRRRRRGRRAGGRGRRAPLSRAGQPAAADATAAAVAVAGGAENRSTRTPWRRPRSLTVSASRPSSSSTVRTMHAPARITSARFGCSPAISRRLAASRVR